MTEWRLPHVNSDDGTWGDILLQYLKKEHYDDGTNNPGVNGGHQNVTIRAGDVTHAPLTFASGPKLTTPSAGAVEFTTDDLFFTITTGTARKRVALYDETGGATGDLLVRTSGGTFTRLGVGSGSQVLGVSSGSPAWVAAPQPSFATSTKTSGYTIGATDTVIFADASSASVTITLPAASTLTGYRFYIKRIDGSANIVTVTSSSNIDGATSFTVDLQYTAFAVVSNGSAWYIL